MREKLALLRGMTLPPSLFPLPTGGGQILSAEKKLSPTDPTVKYADVRGIIAPMDPESYNIEFAMLLPEVWNGRSLQVGGGANCGKIPDLFHPCLLEGNPIDAGYLTYGDDSGHQSEDAMNADFARNSESLENYIRHHLIKTRCAMQRIAEAFYGCAPEYNYFAGGSAGGREALECATTYGAHYDGVFSASPVSNFVLTRLWGAILSRAVYESYDAEKYPFSDGFIDEETLYAIQKDAIARYDGLDGLEDGMVMNIFAARRDSAAFMAEIREKYRLTDAQMRTVDIYENGFTLPYSMANGMNSCGGYAALEGGFMDLGPDPVPREPLDTRYNVHHGDRSDGMFKHFIMKDPTWKLIDHDYLNPDEHLQQKLLEASRAYDVNRPDFDAFRARGGKLILFTAWGDMSISPWQVARQYEGYVEKYGQEGVDSFVRFYAMPHAGHTRGLKMDYLAWLDGWRSTGQYPEEGLFARMDETGGTLPMARYPGWIRYKGGDRMDYRSYEVQYN